jgi:hypothetical protein
MRSERVTRAYLSNMSLDDQSAIAAAVFGPHDTVGPLPPLPRSIRYNLPVQGVFKPL